MTFRFLLFFPVDNPISPFSFQWTFSVVLSNLLAFNAFPSLYYLWGHLPSLMKMLIELPLGLPRDSLFLWDLILRTHILMQNNSRRKFGNKEEQHILSGAVHSATPNQVFCITNTDFPALNASWKEH